MDRGKRSEPAELLAVVLFGFLLRLFAGRSSLTENGILLPGYDEYYHMRRILYTVNHFPNTLWFDSYLNYPHGLSITWPPLFDQISAALCIVLGQHTNEGVVMVSSFVPMLTGILAIVVIYYLVRELFDHRVALMASFLTALAPNYIVNTMFAATDHHGLEVMLQLTTILFIIMAICRNEKRYLFACAAGVAMAALAYTWQGADIYLGIFLVYAFIRMTLDLKEGRPSTDTATTLLIAFGLALVLVLPFWYTPWLSPSFLGIAAMLVALSIMFGLFCFMQTRKISWTTFPLSILVLAVVFALSTRVFGGLFGLGALIQYGLDLILGGGMIGKISEAEPLVYDAKTFYDVVFSALGLNLLISLAGIAASIIYIRRSDGGRRQGQILLLVWAIYTLILTFGQARFLYISTISMGVLLSIFFFLAKDLVDRKLAARTQKAPKGWAVILLLLLITPTLTDAVNMVYIGGGTLPAVAGDWQQSLIWLKDNSNTTSYYKLPEKAPEYSVMSWWDYGNWIVYLAERPVVANNFQAGVEDAAKFYLSESEENATAVLDARGAKYILADFDLVYGKLPALTTWANVDINSYMIMKDEGTQIAATPQQRLFNTTLGRLYFFDGAGTGHFRLIHESSTFLGSGDNPSKSKVKIFEYVPGAIIRVQAEPDQKVGALLNMTSNQGRHFNYVNEAIPMGGAFEIRVPYSTENRYETHAVSPYLVFSGNENGVKMMNLNVSEEDVLKGRTVEVTL
jgi:dolichyl-diphosphooligosaccharide--protein glycosyltransferase